MAASRRMRWRDRYEAEGATVCRSFALGAAFNRPRRTGRRSGQARALAEVVEAGAGPGGRLPRRALAAQGPGAVALGGISLTAPCPGRELQGRLGRQDPGGPRRRMDERFKKNFFVAEGTMAKLPGGAPRRRRAVARSTPASRQKTSWNTPMGGRGGQATSAARR